MELKNRKGEPITDWRGWTRPKDAEKQWRATRSAMELARAWFTAPAPTVPPEVTALLATQPATHGAEFTDGWPELTTPLPERGEGRNHDLVLVGTAGGRGLLVAVEAKVDETMGPLVGGYWRASKRTRGSYAWRRADTLLRCLFGERAVATDAPWKDLPYQMLTASVGTAIEAASRGIGVAALVVHEFQTESARLELLKKNAGEYRVFLAALGVRQAAAGALHGPFRVTVPSGAVVELYVGKAEYRW